VEIGELSLVETALCGAVRFLLPGDSEAGGGGDDALVAGSIKERNELCSGGLDTHSATRDNRMAGIGTDLIHVEAWWRHTSSSSMVFFSSSWWTASIRSSVHAWRQRGVRVSFVFETNM